MAKYHICTDGTIEFETEISPTYALTPENVFASNVLDVNPKKKINVSML